MSPQEESDFNNAIEKWAKVTELDLRDELDRLGVTHSKHSPNKVPLRKVLKTKLYTQRGLITRVGFKIPRSSVFLHKGVGRGRPISQPKGARPWFKPVSENLDHLSAIVAEHQGNFVVNHVLIQ